MPSFDDEKINKVQQYKYGHNSCFSTNDSTPKFISPSSPLVKRVPCFPALVPDLSEAAVNETWVKSSIHKNAEYGSFRRVKAKGGAVEYALERDAVRNLLADVHPTRDEHDISPTRTYTYSRVDKSTAQELRTKPEDFVNPFNLEHERPRTTGYSRGHVRSVHGYDSYGPNQSAQLTIYRKDGLLPSSHNTDRNRRAAATVITDTRKEIEHAESVHDHCSRRGRATYRPGTSNSSLSGGASLADLSFFRSPPGTGSLNNSNSPPYSPIVVGGGSLNGKSEWGDDLSHCSRTTTLRASVVSFEDKSIADPRMRSLVWHESYQQNKKEVSEMQKQDASEKEHRRQMLQEANEMHRTIDKFEEELKSIVRFS